MNKIKVYMVLMLMCFVIISINSQTSSSSDYLIAQPVSDRVVPFDITGQGVSKPILWGLDTAWPDEANIRRGVAFMGNDGVDIVRVSFQPTLPLVNNDIQQQQINAINTRINLVNWTGTKTKLMINCDHPSVDVSYLGNAVNWALLIDATAKRFQQAGREVISVAPFNEPDYGWGQFTGSNGKSDFYNICGELRKNSRFDNIRICGGNTLNSDQALSWYNFLKDRLNEGNTHQLAGSFDNYANFFQTVRANGHHATADELHNVMEAMVGVEYGMQTGIWWGTAEYARGEFCKASDGVRLAYAEHRPNWTSASVYRSPDGKIQAFGGTSERQAVTTSYRFISYDRDVYFDGYGPQREYTMVLPGGTGYQSGQTNAERVVNISWGSDIQPVINGQYVLVNRNSGLVMEIAGGSNSSGANIRQNTFSNVNYKIWNVVPVDSRIGGDFSYFSINSLLNGKSLDVFNWSLENNGNIAIWDDAKGANQQWFLEYVDNGWFYIRSRHSAKCIEVANSSKIATANIQQRDKDNGLNQQWRFIPVGAPVEFVAPAAPTNLVASPNNESIRLDWSVSTDSDVAGYTIFRAETAGGPYNTIARNVTASSFVDNNTDTQKTYFYTVKAIDNSRNSSPYSNEVTGSSTGNKDIVAQYKFDSNTVDSTLNLNHCATYGGTSFVDGKFNTKAISLNGTNAFIQLPYNIANHNQISVSAWVYLKSITNGQHLFNFGNSLSEYMCLIPRTSSSNLRFFIKKGSTENMLNANALPYFNWAHVAVTLDNSGVRLYVNGQLAAETGAFKINPSDIKPALNYIGRSQSSDPLFNGYIDDFRIYNYALSANEIAQISGLYSAVNDTKFDDFKFSVWPVPANDIINIKFSAENTDRISTLSLFNIYGKLIMTKNINQLTEESEFNVSNLSEGIYMLKLKSKDETIVRKIVIKH